MVMRMDNQTEKRVLISYHQLPESDGSNLNDHLSVEAIDKRGPGNAHHEYFVIWDDGTDDVACYIPFQEGPIKQSDVNGVSNEALLAIVIDRLEGFQSGDFACQSNQHALDSCRFALDALHRRTRERIERGVEGTNVQ